MCRRLIACWSLPGKAASHTQVDTAQPKPELPKAPMRPVSQGALPQHQSWKASELPIPHVMHCKLSRALADGQRDAVENAFRLKSEVAAMSCRFPVWHTLGWLGARALS